MNNQELQPRVVSEQPGSGGPSAGLLSFYDRLRSRVARGIERRTGRAGKVPSDVLLLIPDVFIFLVRLTLDREVPRDVRVLVGGALAYFLLPIDLLPEAFLGVGGFVDDLVLAVFVVAQAFDDDLEYFAAKHWSGSGDLRLQLAKISRTASSLVGDDMTGRLKDVLARLGGSRPVD